MPYTEQDEVAETLLSRALRELTLPADFSDVRAFVKRLMFDESPQVIDNTAYSLAGQLRDTAEHLLAEPYIWPGGYERYAITDDGGILCKECVSGNLELIRESTARDGWSIAAITSTEWDDVDPVHCDHCNRAIWDPEA